jgi:two-component system, NtrC family, sensor histidine kinase KinB
MTIRTHSLLTLAPLLLLTAVMGAADVALVYYLRGGIDNILRDNLRSVDYMIDLEHALDDIDDSFRRTLLNGEGTHRQYEAGWVDFKKQQGLEEHNVTIRPRERELADELTERTDDYQRAGDRFFAAPAAEAYFGKRQAEGLAAKYQQIRQTAEEIRLLNEEEMRKASVDAQRAAEVWCLWLGGGLAATALLSSLLTWAALRAVSGRLHDLALTAKAVGVGNLNQIIPEGHDEIGQVARAFNHMTRQLRDYRQSHSTRLLRAQRTGQAVLDSFPDPILVVGPGGQVEMANPAAGRVLGVIGQPSWNQPREGQPPPVVETWQPPGPLRRPLADALDKQQAFFTQAFEQTIAFRFDGEDHAFLPQILPIRDPYGNTLGAAVVFSDVTRFRLLDQIKSDLVATVSHELKTPLTSVRLALHLLLEETVGALTPKQTELLVDARDNAERLLSTIGHLLGLARLEHGGESVEIRREEPRVLLQAAGDALRSRAIAKRIEVVIEAAEDLPAVAVDPQCFGHALDNLLDNALTYTKEGGRITLAAAHKSKGPVRFSVADTGVGIPPEHLPHVFEKFFRVPGGSHGRGTGLGLAIVREIAAAHHGGVSCESRPGIGTVFTLTIPVWKGPGPTEDGGTP